MSVVSASSLAAVEQSTQGSLSLAESEGQITVTRDGVVVLAYNKLAPAVPSNIDPVYARNAFVHPVNTPAGTSVTDVYPVDHAHQSGIFSAWVNTTYDGRPVDFWNIAKGSGRVMFSKVTAKSIQPHRVSFTVEHVHRIMKEPKVDVLREICKMTVYPGDSDHHCFDLEIEQHALTDKPLHVNQYHYGGVAIRGRSQWLLPKRRKAQTQASTLDQTSSGITNDVSAGRVEGNHQPTRWVSMWGAIDDDTASITMMSHPRNFRAPQEARLHPTKPYFCFAPCVKEAFVIDKDHPFTGRYRFLVTDQNPDPDWLSDQWVKFTQD